MSLGKTYVAIDLEPQLRELGLSSPLHLKLTPPVKLGRAETGRIIDGLTDNLRGFGGVILRAADEDTFGPHSDPVRVRRFRRTLPLLNLHEAALAVVSDVVPDIDTTYTGDNYQPHSTYKGDKGIEEGEVIVARHVVVLRKEDDIWERAGIISLAPERG